MDQAETFEWLRQRSSRLDEVEVELAQVKAENICLLLEKAQRTVKPIVNREKQGEEIGDLMNMRLDATTGASTGGQRDTSASVSVLMGYEAALREVNECEKCDLCEDHLPTTPPAAAAEGGLHAANPDAFCLACNEHPCKLLPASTAATAGGTAQDGSPGLDCLVHGHKWKQEGTKHFCTWCGTGVNVGPDADKPSTIAPGEGATSAAQEIVPDCLSRTCFIKDCSRDSCWGCDDSKKERARVVEILSRHFPPTEPTLPATEEDNELLCDETQRLREELGTLYAKMLRGELVDGPATAEMQLDPRTVIFHKQGADLPCDKCGNVGTTWEMDIDGGIVIRCAEHSLRSEATQVAVEAAATEVVQRVYGTAPDEFHDLVKLVSAIIAKHCAAPADASRSDRLQRELTHAVKKWQEYERNYILPCFKWATECGIDLQQLVAENAGRNCEDLLVSQLRAELTTARADAIAECVEAAKKDITERITIARTEKESAEKAGFDRDALRLDGVLGVLENILNDIEIVAESGAVQANSTAIQSCVDIVNDV